MIDALRLYSEMSGLLLLGAVLFAIAEWAGRKAKWLPSRRGLLRAAQGFLLLSLILPLGARFLPGRSSLSMRLPPVQIWSGADSRATTAALSVTLPPQVRAPLPAGDFLVVDKYARWLGLILIVWAVLSAGRQILHWVRLRRHVEGLPVARRWGRVTIAVSDESPVPYATRLGGRAYIVVPSTLLLEREAYLIAVRHELQHHRQGDTRWAYAMQLFKALFVFHPAIYLWDRWLTRCQELACDEFLVTFRHVPAGAYGHCLLQTAHNALARPRGVVAGLAFRAAPSFLRQRIEALFSYPRPSRGTRAALVVFAGAGTLGLVAALLLGRGMVRDRRVSLAEAWALAEKASIGSAFPIVVNDLVLAELNRYLGTPNGRDWMQRAIERLPIYRPLVERKLAAYGLPQELLAIPIMESGFQNLPRRSKEGYRGAGLWMFIETTARRYGLHVDADTDERMDIEKETDAAMRYLASLYRVFHDWPLAIAAYNEGARHVLASVKQTRARDAWELCRRKALNPYLSQAMASLIIMRNPQALE